MKRVVTFSNQIPKKSRKEAKQCTLCKNHRGTQNTHITGDCKKYNLDDAPKKGFAGKNAQHNPCNMEARDAVRRLTTLSCLQKLLSLKSPTGNSSVQVRNASVIMIVTVTTPMHLEAMGPVALGN